MTVGIVGLGLIGGSFAKAYSEAGHTVLTHEVDKTVQSFAQLSGASAGALTKENITQCELVLICIYPQAAVTYMEEMGPYIDAHTIVIDCCGTKREIVKIGMEAAEKYGFIYIGGHPMAGTQYSGFKYARSNLYHNAPMVLVPPAYDDIELLSRVKELLKPAGFGRITVTTAEKHDEMIAFTSQLAHVVSNAYVKSPTALSHKGFSAGSYKDLTRVAWLNPQMWAELFLDDKDYLVNELDILIGNLQKYRDAIAEGRQEELIELLSEGRKRKEEIDGR